MSLIQTRQKRLQQLKLLGDRHREDGKEWSEIRSILDKYMLKTWALSYNARLDYLHALEAWYED